MKIYKEILFLLIFFDSFLKMNIYVCSAKNYRIEKLQYVEHKFIYGTLLRKIL